MEGYPVTLEAYPGVRSHSASTFIRRTRRQQGLRFEVATNIPGQGCLRRIVTADRFGGDTAPGAEPLVTPLPVPNPSAETGVMSGGAVRSRIDPNSVLYYPFGNFDTRGYHCDPSAPAAAVVARSRGVGWDASAGRESRRSTLTFRAGRTRGGQRTPRHCNRSTAATGEAVEVPLTLDGDAGDGARRRSPPNRRRRHLLSVYPNPTRVSATVAITLRGRSRCSRGRLRRSRAQWWRSSTRERLAVGPPCLSTRCGSTSGRDLPRSC